MRKAVAAILLSLMMVPIFGSAAQASGVKEGVACLYYYTFAQRDPVDYVECFI